MTTTPFSMKSKLAGPGSTLSITPTNSPVPKSPARSPNKIGPHQSSLSLHTVIGTTTSSPTGFDYHKSSRTFALCAGSAVILVEFDENFSLSQRFFRSRPTTSSVNPSQSIYNPTAVAFTPENRRRTLGAIRSGTQNGPYAVSPGREWNEGAASKALTSKERIKAATSVSISHDGKLLAVGETGYAPRVLIFSTARDHPCDIPLSILTEHSFGVRAVAFSPESQFLATLGEVNDGFLFVWTVNQRTGAARLHSTNKCTSFVRHMAWVGNHLVTVGTRHVKVWRVGELGNTSPNKFHRFAVEGDSMPSPAPKALSGRNCLLGALVEATFTCVTAISSNSAVVCTDRGVICILDDQAGKQELRQVRDLTWPIMSITADQETEQIWFGGAHQQVKMLKFRDLESRADVQETSHSHPQSPSAFPLSPPFHSSASTPNGIVRRTSVGTGTIIALGTLAGLLITLDSDRAIKTRELVTTDCEALQACSEVLVSAHRDAVHGVGLVNKPNQFNADFFTWSSGGSVGFWSIPGTRLKSTSIELEQLSTGEDEVPNELKVLRASADNAFFVSGDKYGVMKLTQSDPWTTINEIRAHGAEITDIALQGTGESLLVASCGRDRMVQLFQKTSTSLNLVQTMDDHVGVVGHILFDQDGEKLVSSSADRTVIVRDRMTRDFAGVTIIAYFMSRVITLKASPVSMSLIPDDPGTLAVSTIDRHILKFDMTSGSQIHSFRASDPETNDNVVMSSLSISKDGVSNTPKILVGVSTTDKSIRIYDYERGPLLTREFGHTEGVSDVVMIEHASSDNRSQPKRTLISTGLDGIIMIWDLSVQATPLQELSQPHTRTDDSTPVKELTAAKPPLRRILSRSELAEFQRPNPPSGTSTPVREQSPPRIRKKTSRYTLGSQSMRASNAASPAAIPNFQPPQSQQQSPTSTLVELNNVRNRSPSPPSPKTPRGASRMRRPSLADLRSRNKSATNVAEFGSLNMSTEQCVRTLRAYRKKLAASNTSTDPLLSAAELEKELLLTARVLGRRIGGPPSKQKAESESEVDGLGRNMSEVIISGSQDASDTAPTGGEVGLGIGNPISSSPTKMDQSSPSPKDETMEKVGDEKFLNSNIVKVDGEG